MKCPALPESTVRFREIWSSVTYEPATNEKPIPLGGADVSIAVAAVGDDDCRPLLLAGTVVDPESATAVLA